MEAKPGRISNRHVSITGHAVEAKDMSSCVIVIGSFSLMHSVILKISVKLSETEKLKKSVQAGKTKNHLHCR